MARLAWSALTLAIVTTALTGAAAPAFAEGSDTTVGADTVVNAIVARSRGEITDDLQDARTIRDRADWQLPEAQAAISTAKARLEIRKKEIELVEKQIDLAKKEKNDADRARYERDKNALDRRKKLIEAEIDMAEAYKDLVEVRRDFAREQIQALEREMELSIAGAVPNESVQRNLLESMEKVGSRREEMGRRERRLVDRQRKVLDAARQIARS